MVTGQTMGDHGGHLKGPWVVLSVKWGNQRRILKRGVTRSDFKRIALVTVLKIDWVAERSQGRETS